MNTNKNSYTLIYASDHGSGRCIPARLRFFCLEAYAGSKRST